MYLKEIITSGFKSFADKMDIKLDGKTTCIVGPNGSGKSNIVDAVRWVLGEQSVKSLRGDGSMSDVIFSGSKSRNPLNVANVELIFDNSDHFLNVPYTEISIKRRVYRSGENEYYLNNEKCRLKDISNLLMDTGMAKESFNIISQGEVDRILSNSATDRRIIFEEAACILKYKRRKEEALRKLDRTHNNLDRINDIIAELELQVAPLKEQSEKAKEYLENKQSLDKYEVALLAYDIENINAALEQAKQQRERLSSEIITLKAESSKQDATSLDDSNTLQKLENQKATLNKSLLEITEEVERINGEKNLLKERSKTTKEEDELKEEIRTLLNKKSNLERNISVLEEDMSLITKDLAKNSSLITETETKLKSLSSKKTMLTNEYSKHQEEIISNTSKIKALQTEISEDQTLPNSVKKVLRNPSLTGIDNTIGNVLSIEDKYTKALNIAISSNKNFIITTDEASAKKAITYLKDNHLGRATFFPLTVIKERYVDQTSLNLLQKDPSFLGVLSDLVTYNPKYHNIITNQLGTTLVATDINSATNLSHLIKAHYKIVTLDGDVVNVGGSLSGGSTYNAKSVILLKQELKHTEEKLALLTNESTSISEELQALNQEISQIESELFTLSKNKVEITEANNQKLEMLTSLKEELSAIATEEESLQLISSNTISLKEQELIKNYHEKSAQKEQLQLNIKSLTTEIDSLKSKIEKSLADEKLTNSKLRTLEKQFQELEIEINRNDVLLDNMLNTLSEDYEITFEKAKNDYKLDLEPDEARIKVNTYKNNIKRLGMVNLNAIDEFERVNTRYVFLTNQKEDLLNAENTLLEIMNEMDDVMKEEFFTTFQAIKVEFKKVFQELFGGGTADLKLTDPDNLLTTGVEIVASPPGKKLTTITLLSGGEKTLTAISLLFAILNVRSVPFCLFDEVEAALDEANVSRFGNYLAHYKDKTQFLIITHKKKTMEFANTLYGITMQESGVSKLVSVKLEDSKELI